MVRCLLLLVPLAACSSRLELGHDLPDDLSPKPAPAERTTATCDGESCFRGKVLELSTEMGGAKGLVLDADDVYWAAPDQGMLMITARDGSRTVGVAVPDGGPYRLAMDPSTVYFSGDTGGYVAAVRKGTEKVSVLVADQASAHSIAVTNGTLYFSDPKEGALKRTSFDVTLPDEVSTGLAVETMVEGIGATGDLAVDAEWLYYSDSERGVLDAVDRKTGEVVRLSAGWSHPGALLVRENWLYFLELGTAESGYVDGRLLRVPRVGGDAEVLVTELDAPVGLAADETSVYVSTRGNEANGFRGRIVRRSDTGQVSTLATDQPEAISIAVDDRAVFWTVESEAGLHSLER